SDAPLHQRYRLLRGVLLVAHLRMCFNLRHAKRPDWPVDVRPRHFRLRSCPLVVLLLVPKEPAPGRRERVVIASPNDDVWRHARQVKHAVDDRAIPLPRFRRVKAPARLRVLPSSALPLVSEAIWRVSENQIYAWHRWQKFRGVSVVDRHLPVVVIRLR